MQQRERGLKSPTAKVNSTPEETFLLNQAKIIDGIIDHNRGEKTIFIPGNEKQKSFELPIIILGKIRYGIWNSLREDFKHEPDEVNKLMNDNPVTSNAK